MRRALLPVVLFVCACSPPERVVGEAPTYDATPAPELHFARSTRTADLGGYGYFAALVSGGFTLAFGDGFPETTRVRWRSLELPGCASGRLSLTSAEATGEVVTATLEEDGDLLLTAWSEGPFVLHVSGVYTPVRTCPGEHEVPRRMALEVNGSARRVAGYQVDFGCGFVDEVVVPQDRVNGQRIRPVDADGVPFDPINAGPSAAPFTLTAAPGGPQLRSLSDEGWWSSSERGTFRLEVQTALPVSGHQRVRVASPADVSAVRFGSNVDGGVLTLDPSRPYFVPTLEGITSAGVEFCGLPPPSYFALESFTPEVCAPVTGVWGFGVAAELKREGRCQVRVGVVGRPRLSTEFVFEVGR